MYASLNEFDLFERDEMLSMCCSLAKERTMSEMKRSLSCLQENCKNNIIREKINDIYYKYIFESVNSYRIDINHPYDDDLPLTFIVKHMEQSILLFLEGDIRRLNAFLSLVL